MKHYVFAGALVLGMALFRSSAQSQQLRRKDAEHKYKILKGHETIASKGVTAWTYSGYDKKWSQGSGSISTCYELGTDIYSNFDAIQLSKISDGKDSLPVLSIVYTDGFYEYPEIKAGWKTITAWDSFVLSPNGDVAKLRSHIHQLDTAKQSEFSPGVLTLIFPYRTSEIINGELDEDAVNYWMDSNKSDYSKYQFGISIFPVVVDGVKTVRFLMFHTTGYDEPKVDPKCFDEGYFEMPASTFDGFLAKMGS